VTPTDGAGAVPAGGSSSLPLSGGPGIDPAGIMTGARGASLKRDAKAQVTPARCIARSAAWIELRYMAEARAAVGRRKASAPRSARAASDDAAHSFAPFGALPPLIFWRRTLRAVRYQNSDADVSRERDRFSFRPRDSGEGDHWSSRSERTVVEGAPDSELRCRCRKFSSREEASEKCLGIAEMFVKR
jgi:hypothetical protein